MACQFKNVKITAIGPPGSAPDVEISGEAVNCNCKELAITVVGCDNRTGSRPTLKVKPDSAGKWKVKFEQIFVPFGSLECTCGSDITFGVSCLDANGQSTHQQIFTYKIECKPPAPPACPIISIKEISNTCNPDGTRTFKVETTIDNNTSSVAFFQWYYDTTNGTGGKPGPSITILKGKKITQPQSFTFKADGKDHEISIKISHPRGCQTKTILVKSKPCTPQDKCPKLDGKIKATIHKANGIGDGCKVNQKVDVDLIVNLIKGASTTVDYQWLSGTTYSKTKTITFSGNTAQIKDVFSDLPGDGKEHEIKLIIVNPKNCSGGSVKIKTPICKKSCPLVSVKEEASEECQNGNRKVTFSITGTMPQGVTGEVALIDITDSANPKEIGKQDQLTGAISFKLSKDYPPGKYKVQLKIIDPKGCPINTYREITVLPCPGTKCPKTTYAKPAISDKCTTEGKREVTVEATISPQSIGKVTAQLINTADPSTILDEKKDQTGIFTLTHKKEYTGGTTQEFKVIYNQASGCKDSGTKISIPPCKKEPKSEEPNPETPTEGGGCIVSRIIAIVAVSTAIISFLLIVCFPAAVKLLVILGIAFAAVAVLLLVLYGLFCNPKPCNWWLLIIGQSLIGTGLFGAWISKCCPLMFWIGIFATLAGILLLVLWKALCNLPWCQWGKEVLYVMAGIIAPIISFIALVPFLNNCLSGVAGGIVTGVTLVLGVLGIATCINNTPTKPGNTSGKP